MRIADVLKVMGIDKDTFSNLYEEAIGSPLKLKSSVISVKNFEQIKKLQKTKGIDKITEVKVIKSDEFKENAIGFLSGLGFGVENQEPIVEEIDVVKNKIEEIIEDKLDNSGYVSFQSKDKENRDSKFFKKEKTVFNKPIIKKVIDKKPENTPKMQSTINSDGKKVFTFSNAPKKQISKTYQKVSFVNKKEEPKSMHNMVKKEIKELTTSQNLVKKKEITLSGKNITVKEFSEKMGIELSEIMKVLLKNKIMVGINSSLDFDTACLVAEDLGVIIKKEDQMLDVESFLSGDLQAILDLDKSADNLEDRPPIVTIMGHVDHGKTTLLDYLRKTTIASGEAGGITQGIGASVVEYDNKKITFIDTPGHELFTSLRARGSKLTNIVVIVVACDDGVMPQTVESINHAKAAGVPLIIAVTKIDKPGKSIEQIKTDVAKYGLVPEDRGGNIPFVSISAISGQGVSDLLEAIVLQAEMLELKYNPNRSAVGVVLDAYKDAKQGIVTSLIILTGTLKIRDTIVAYNTYGKIKRMWNWLGKDIKEVRGGEPIQVLGFTNLPEPGRMIEIVANEKDAMKKVELIKSISEMDGSDTSVLQQFLLQLKSSGNTSEISTLKLILKAEGSSSLEALKQAVSNIICPEKIEIKIIHSDVGHFSDSDLSLAQASKALIVGFNVLLTTPLKKKAQSFGVDVKSFEVIYEIIDYLEKLVLGMIKIEQEEVVVGKLQVLGVFFRKGREMVIGGKVTEGKIVNGYSFRVYREGEEFFNGNMVSLQRDKQSVKEVSVGYECGMKVKVSKKILEGDMIEFYVMQDKVS